MNTKIILAAGCAILMSGFCTSVQAIAKDTKNATRTDDNTIKIESGLVQGFEQEGTKAFLGIPYARVERFMPPQPVMAWDTVMICNHWGPQAMQNVGDRQMTEAEMSENSCVLNVWTTDTKNRKPVMLWLHGGGFDSGTSAWDPGMGLAKQDVVVVSINHRLNILGFLDLSAISPKYKYSGNVGMMDVVAALRWIKTNIALFGGDPDNITVFGESGGGGKVGTLLCMPEAKDLFHKAIIMSGTILNVNDKEMTETLGKAVLEELGIDAAHIDQIKEVPYKELYAAGQRAMAKSIGTRRPGTPMMWGFGPTPDGEVLLQQPFQPGFASIADNKPIIIGTTFNELQPLTYDKPISDAQARDMLLPTFGQHTDEFIEAFHEAWPNLMTSDLLSADRLFRPKTIITADYISAHRKAPTYTYMFTWKSPINHASVHGHELKFCFNTLHHAGRDLPSPTREDKQLAKVMSRAWAAFAHTGDPNISELPTWHPYNAQNGEMMVFGNDCFVRHNPDRKMAEIIDQCCFKQLEVFRSKRLEAQPYRISSTNINPQWPRILEDNSVLLRVKTDNASQWRVSLDPEARFRCQPDGSWIAHTRPLVEGFHYYWYNVGGVEMSDPATQSYFGCGRMCSAIDIPEQGTEWMDYREDVAHGQTHIVSYYSPLRKATANVWVYTPAGYEKSTRRYPVLYLQHGGGEDESGWIRQGKANLILDNLIAEGKAKEMIVVMANGTLSVPGMRPAYTVEGMAGFGQELTESIIPCVEQHFRTLADRKHRALSGLSMGGGQTFFVGLTHTDLFSAVGIFSTGLFGGIPNSGKDFDAEATIPGLLTRSADYNADLTTFYISVGEQDFRIRHTEKAVNDMRAKGLDIIYETFPGDHEWQVWRKSLHSFVQKLF